MSVVVHDVGRKRWLLVVVIDGGHRWWPIISDWQWLFMKVAAGGGYWWLPLVVSNGGQCRLSVIVHDDGHRRGTVRWDN